MRRLIIVLLSLVFLSFPLQAWGEAVDLANEEFEATGYDLGACGAAPCWTEQLAGGSTAYEDYAVSGAPGSPPAVWKTLALQIVHATGTNGRAYYNINSEVAITYTRIEFVIDDYGSLDDQEAIVLAKGGDAEGQPCWQLFLKNDTGTHKIYVNFYNNAVYKGVSGSATAVTEDTYYVVEVMYDVTATDGDARIYYTRNSPTDYATVELDANPDGVQYFYCGGDDNDDETWTGVFDEVAVDDSEWVGLSIIPGQVIIVATGE